MSGGLAALCSEQISCLKLPSLGHLRCASASSLEMSSWRAFSRAGNLSAMMRSRRTQTPGTLRSDTPRRHVIMKVAVAAQPEPDFFGLILVL